MKKIMKILAVVLIMLSMTAITAYAFPGFEITVPGNSEPTGQYGSVQAFAISVNGDVNGDGKVDSLDAAQVLKYDAGMITEFVSKKAEYTLSEEEKTAIRETFYNEYCKEDDLYSEGISRAEIGGCYGEYNGWQVVAMRDTAWQYPEESGWHYTHTLNGYTFCYSYSELYVVKDNEIYELWEAYEKGLLTDENIRDIAIQYCTVPADLWDDEGDWWNPDEYGGEHLVCNIFGDANNDRKVDSIDAAWILKYDAGLVE